LSGPPFSFIFFYFFFMEKEGNAFSTFRVVFIVNHRTTFRIDF